MLTRALRTRVPFRALSTSVRASYSAKPTANDSSISVPVNDPNPKPPKLNVSETNTTPTSSEGSFDQVLVESVEKAMEARVMQAPNRKGIWSRSQQPRELAMVGPRFEQMIMEDQVRGWDLRVEVHGKYSRRSADVTGNPGKMVVP
jgi:NADH dehydrogenase (ubiquinone) Fe-S protein 6